MSGEERVRMDTIMEDERVCMEHNAIINFLMKNLILEEGKYHPN